MDFGKFEFEVYEHLMPGLLAVALAKQVVSGEGSLINPGFPDTLVAGVMLVTVSYVVGLVMAQVSHILLDERAEPFTSVYRKRIQKRFDPNWKSAKTEQQGSQTKTEPEGGTKKSRWWQLVSFPCEAERDMYQEWYDEIRAENPNAPGAAREISRARLLRNLWLPFTLLIVVLIEKGLDGVEGLRMHPVLAVLLAILTVAISALIAGYLVCASFAYQEGVVCAQYAKPRRAVARQSTSSE